jgi:DNA-directed RNA polymerase subunit RPC12/RpoP
MPVVPLRDIVRCPECGSRDVVYSCEPKCCFNHVCADCKTTFQITTAKTGRTDQTTGDVSRPESGDPTTSCCCCHSINVGALTTNAPATNAIHTPATMADSEVLLVCGDCRAILTLQYEDIASGQVLPS